MPESAKKEKSGKKAKTPKKGKIAAVLIRSAVNTGPKARKTLEELRLKRKNSCVVLDDNASNRGMFKVVKDRVAWGEVSPETAKKMGAGQEGNFYRLHPPRGGFDRKGIKKPFKVGGALGYRGKEMDKLLRKMI